MQTIDATKPARSTRSQEQRSTSPDLTSSDDGSRYTAPRKRMKSGHHPAQPSTIVDSLSSQNSRAERPSQASPTPRAFRSQAPSQEDPSLREGSQCSRRPSIEPLSSETPAEAVLNPLNEDEGGPSTENGLNVTKSLDINLAQWESHLILAMRDYLDVPRFQNPRIPPHTQVFAALSGIVQQLKKGITAFVRYKSFQSITAHRMRDAGYNLCSTLVGGHYDFGSGDIERNLEVLLSRRPAPTGTVLLALSMSFVTKDILQPFGDLQASLPEPFQAMEFVKSKSSIS